MLITSLMRNFIIRGNSMMMDGKWKHRQCSTCNANRDDSSDSLILPVFVLLSFAWQTIVTAQCTSMIILVITIKPMAPWSKIHICCKNQIQRSAHSSFNSKSLCVWHKTQIIVIIIVSEIRLGLAKVKVQILLQWFIC